MKLAELKAKYKNKYMIRIVAGILTVALLAGSTAVYDVYGAKNEKAVEEAAEKKEAEEKLEGILAKDETASEKQIDKDETVYIIADSTGKAKSTIVSEWLKNPEKKDILEDVSDLKEIENVKGDETFEQKGNSLSWRAEGSDIYYQGTTAKEAPVTEKITYYLDGKEISAEDLAGKSGEVKIRFDYTNNEKVGDVYVPFLAISGMVLGDNFTNIEVTNGKVISNGDSNIVIGAAMPGLKESLQIEESDFTEDISIPDYVEVTADAEDFALDMTMTVLTDLSDFASDAALDFSELDGKIEDLTTAMGQLKDGSGELAEGMDTLNEKMGEFSDGLDTLQNGIAAYTGGAKTLADGIGTLKGQTGLLIAGISDLAASVDTLNAGVETLDQSLNTEMGEKEKAKAAAEAQAAAESAVDAQFADDSNPQSYNNIKAQAEQAFYSSVASDSVKQAAAAAAKQSAVAGIQEQKSVIAAQAREQAVAGVNGQIDTIAAQAKAQAEAAAAGAIPLETQAQLQAAFTAAGYVQAAQANGITVEQAMANADIQAAVTQAAAAQMQTLLGTIQTAAGTVADQTARGVAEQVAGSVAEQAAGSVAEQVAGTVAEQVAPGVVTSVAEQAKSSVGTSLADSVKQGAKTAAGQAAGQAAVQGAESAKKQIAQNIEKKDNKSGYSLVSGMKALQEAVGGMSGKMPQLTSGIDQLYTGSQTLTSKNEELNSGAAKLRSGKDQLTLGVFQLKDGSRELADGMIQFDEEGIEKLVNSYNGDIKEFSDRICDVIDAGKSYESFGGKAEQAAGNVKFIIKTAEIKAEEK